jgi:hypothetical protein
LFGNHARLSTGLNGPELKPYSPEIRAVALKKSALAGRRRAHFTAIYLLEILEH